MEMEADAGGDNGDPPSTVAPGATEEEYTDNPASIMDEGQANALDHIENTGNSGSAENNETRPLEGTTEAGAHLHDFEARQSPAPLVDERATDTATTVGATMVPKVAPNTVENVQMDIKAYKEFSDYVTITENYRFSELGSCKLSGGI